MTSAIIRRLDEGDRALFTQCATAGAASGRGRRAWTALTQLGGAAFAVPAAVLPLLLDGRVRAAAWHAVLTLVLSHLAVQLVKRTVGRPRPSRTLACATLIEEPDKFSFPSGHAAAAMSLAVAYGLAFPALAAPLVVLALVVGASRVWLGVHYPGDVVSGQIIAAGTGVVVAAFR
jgi:undecaprenyl-diphosphatase